MDSISDSPDCRQAGILKMQVRFCGRVWLPVQVKFDLVKVACTV